MDSLQKQLIFYLSGRPTFTSTFCLLLMLLKNKFDSIKLGVL